MRGRVARHLRALDGRRVGGLPRRVARRGVAGGEGGRGGHRTGRVSQAAGSWVGRVAGRYGTGRVAGARVR